MTSWVITTNTTMSALPFVDLDDIQSVTNCKLTIDQVNAPVGGVYPINANGILSGTGNGGVIEQLAGTNVHIKDTKSITISEGARWQSLGTSGSRCAITGESKTNTAHKFVTSTGGKIYLSYTDISTFYMLGVNGGEITLNNSTLISVQYPYIDTMGGLFSVINSTINQDTASRYCMLATLTNHARFECINTAFISATNNFLLSAASMLWVSLAGCTYAGGGGAAASIAADDFPLTTCDYDIRIYEASTVTEGTPLAGVGVSLTHPSMDSLGMAYDSTNYLKIPMYLSYPVTDAAGLTTIYTLQKNAYWPSGLAVVSRTWKYWSDYSQAEAGDNQKYTFTLGKLNYISDTDSKFSGQAVSGTLGVFQAIPTPSNNPPLSVFSDAPCTTRTSTLTVGDTGYVNGGVVLKSIGTDTRTATTLIQVRKGSDDSVMATLYNAADSLIGGDEYSYKDSSEFGGGTAYNFSTTGYVPGEYYLFVQTSGTNITTAIDICTFKVLAVVIPKAVFSTDYFLYVSDVATGLVPTPTIIQGDSLRLSGQVTLSGADTVDNDTDILLYKADGTLVETIPTSQFSSSDGVTQDLDAILGGIFTKDTTLLDPGAYYYLMNISGSDLEESLQVIAEFEVVVTGAAPFISDVAMSSSSITQGGSTRITFQATNMTATDFCYVEAVGKGIIKRFVTTDNLNYLLVLYGADLPVMTSNTLTISAINVGGSDTDSTLVLTVTAVPATIPSTTFRDFIPIVDEVDIVIKLIKTDLLNHRLKHILPFNNIYKEQPLNWKDFPGLYIRKVSNVTLVETESLGEDYNTGVEKIGNVWQCDIAFDLVAHVKTIFNYPPIETNEADSVRYEHAKNCLPVLHKVLHAILSENRQYLDPDGSTLMWDFVEAVPNGYNLIDGGYNGAKDVWAIQLLYRFQFEMEVQ